jgi:amino acid permease
LVSANVVNTSPSGGLSSFSGIASGKTAQARREKKFDDFTAATPQLVAQTGGTATVLASGLNLAKAILGSGLLSLPGGVSYFSNAKSALAPAIAIFVGMAGLGIYTFKSIPVAMIATGGSSYSECWGALMGAKYEWIVSFGCTLKCLFAALAQSIVLGDAFSSLAITFGLPPQLASRAAVVTAVHVGALLPLSLMRDLASLAPFSVLGLFTVFYTVGFMVFRLFEGSYKPGGKFHDAKQAASQTKPKFYGSGAVNAKTLVLLAMTVSSLIAHYLAAKFYSGLIDTDLSKFQQMAAIGYSLAVVMSIVSMVAGFLTFGSQSQGLILNNYSNKDPLATLARAGIALAILFGYPFTFAALRDGLWDFVRTSKDARTEQFSLLTVGLMSILTVSAIALKDVSFVVSLSGSLFGSFLMFTAPALMNIKRLADMPGAALEILFNKFIVVFGSGLNVLGVVITIMKQMGRL